MANNPYVNKVQKADGTVLIDISDTTAVASDVASGKYFYTAAGAKVEGTGGGGTITTIVPQQTVTANSTTTNLNYNSGLVEGESYIVTVNGETKSIVCTRANNSYELYFTSTLEVIWIFGDMLWYIDDSSEYGTYTVKVEQESGGGSTLITKTITVNGTYSAQDDNADGYSSVTVNVQGGSSKNIQTVQTTDRRNNTALGEVISLTCSTTGTYDVYWSCARNSTSGTWGSQLYIGGSAYGSENTTWTNNVQTNHLENVSISANQTVAVYGRSRSGNYFYAPQLTIMQK